MQLRRALLLFALVLGLSALVAALVPPPESADEGDSRPVVEAPSSTADTEDGPRQVRFSAGGQSDAPTRAVALGSRVSLEVAVPGPGDVAVEGLGLRLAADRLTPARFELLARPAGRYDVRFIPLAGEPRLVGRLAFGG